MRRGAGVRRVTILSVFVLEAWLIGFGWYSHKPVCTAAQEQANMAALDKRIANSVSKDLPVGGPLPFPDCREPAPTWQEAEQWPGTASMVAVMLLLVSALAVWLLNGMCLAARSAAQALWLWWQLRTVERTQEWK